MISLFKSNLINQSNPSIYLILKLFIKNQINQLGPSNLIKFKIITPILIKKINTSYVHTGSSNYLLIDLLVYIFDLNYNKLIC